MSELKAIESATAVIENVHMVYRKSEADKVIAELEDKLRHYPIMTALIESGNKEIAELQKQVHDYAQGLYVIQAKAEKEVRHQKYKRCLAMAKWCFTKSNYHFVLARHGEDAKKNSRKSELYAKWNNRWLAIAKKFKEAK